MLCAAPQSLARCAQFDPRLSHSGCVVFGRVAGDSAASYLLQDVSSGKAAARLGQVGGHLGMATTIRIDPGTQKVHLEFSWADQQGGAQQGGEGQGGQVQTNETKAATPAKPAKEEPKKVEQKEYTMEEVKKHNTEGDCWVSLLGRRSAVALSALDSRADPGLALHRLSLTARSSTPPPSSTIVSSPSDTPPSYLPSADLSAPPPPRPRRPSRYCPLRRQGGDGGVQHGARRRCR